VAPAGLAAQIISHALHCGEDAIAAEVGVAAARIHWEHYADDEALALIDLASAAAERSGGERHEMRVILIDCDLLRGAIATFRGRSAEALAAFRSAEGRARDAHLPLLAIDAINGLATQHVVGTHWNEVIAESRRALEAADAARYERGRAMALLNLGRAEYAAARIDAALSSYREALGIAIDVADAPTETTARNRIGHIHLQRGDLESAAVEYRAAFAAAEISADPSGQAAASNNLGLISYLQNRYEEAAIRFNECLIISRRNGNLRNEAEALLNIGSVHTARSEFSTARESYARCLALRERLGDEQGASAALTNLGHVWMVSGRLAQAQHCLDRAAEILSRHADASTEAAVCNMRGILFTMMRRLEEADAMLRESAAISEKLGDRTGELKAKLNLAYVEILHDRAPLAIEQFDELMPTLDAAAPPEGRAYARADRAEARLAVGDVGGAIDDAVAAIALAREAQAAVAEAHALVILARGSREHGDPASAVAAATRSLELAEPLDLLITLAEAHGELALALRAMGDGVAARPHGETCIELLRESGAGTVDVWEKKLASVRPGE
jgi:tetratricopeptide (TPR) repeat protein